MKSKFQAFIKNQSIGVREIDIPKREKLNKSNTTVKQWARQHNQKIRTERNCRERFLVFHREKKKQHKGKLSGLFLVLHYFVAVQCHEQREDNVHLFLL